MSEPRAQTLGSDVLTEARLDALQWYIFSHTQPVEPVPSHGEQGLTDRA
jgi:hypothetical protein